jgi:hypothetical protein
MTACGTRSNVRSVAPSAAATDSTTTSTSFLTITASRARSYRSVAELARDATLVIVGTANGATTESLGGIPFTTTSVEVVRVLSGDAAVGATIPVHQTGGPGIVSPELPPVMRPGQRYLLFLEPFTGPGVQTPQRYTIVGLAGIWGLEGGVARRLDPASTELPDGLSVSSLEAQVRTALGTR